MSTPEDRARNFPDDRTVADNVPLLRRIPPWHFFNDPKLQRMRPSSAAFEDDDDGAPTSVYRRDIIDSEGGVVDRLMIGHERFGLVSLTAGQFRSRRQTISPDPLPEETAHTVVCGPKTDGARRWFTKQAEWVVLPPE